MGGERRENIKFITLKHKANYPRLIFHLLHFFPSQAGYWFPSAQRSHNIRVSLTWALVAADTSYGTLFAWVWDSIHSILIQQSAIAFMVMPFSSLSPLPLQISMLLFTVTKTKKVLRTLADLSVDQRGREKEELQIKVTFHLTTTKMRDTRFKQNFVLPL